MKRFKTTISYLLTIHILALSVLSISRLVLLLTNMQQLQEIDNSIGLVARAMLKGTQFDNLIGCYILALPMLILLVSSVFSFSLKPLIKICSGYFILLYIPVFAISIADIPYFSYHFTHLNASIFAWMGFDGTADMLLGESSYYLYFGLFLLLTALFAYLVIRVCQKYTKKKEQEVSTKSLKYSIPLIILAFGMCFLGIRGGVHRYPLKVSEAYFCSHSFINQLALSPSFFLIKTYSSYSKEYSNVAALVNEQEAIENVKKYLKIEDSNIALPIARQVNAKGTPITPNIVIVLMESMSHAYLDYRRADGVEITPFLNNLKNEAYYFPHFFSSGIHTNNGIASSLYGYPPQFNKTMMDVDVDHYDGLTHNLKKMGYETLFFVSHNPNYDNMGSFLYENEFDRVYSQFDYPQSKVANNFGVQDDYLFEYGIETLSKSKTPFLATIMTITNHPPFIVHEKFKDYGDTQEEKIIAYSDSAIEEFMKDAAKQDWYDNTIFVLLGDHGRRVGEADYEIPLSQNHVPLLIYSPLFNDAPKRFEQFGGQIDVFPTIMGLLNQSYVNNTLGVDLLKTKRPYMFYVNDNAMGCIDEEYYYLYSVAAQQESLFKYKSDRPNDNIIQKYAAKADSMKTYAASMMITSNYLIKAKLTGKNTSGID